MPPRLLRDPALGHLTGKGLRYEGWYARVTDPVQGESFALIHGVMDPVNGARVGWVIALSGRDARRVFQAFPAHQVAAPRDEAWVRIGPCHFAPTRVEGALGGSAERCDWRLDLAPRVVSGARLADSPMSYALLVPGLETAWHPLALDAAATGVVTFADRAVMFANAPAYTEKVWGTAFPRRWYWMQANAFDRPGASLCLSGGLVPVPGLDLAVRAGMILWHDGTRLHRFASHVGATIRDEVAPGRWRLDARRPRLRLQVEADCPPEALVPLESPTPDGLHRIAHESLAGTVRVRLWHRPHPLVRWTLLHEARSQWAGVEWGGR
ncbi:MAG: hypothetical protein KC620_16030 [Myxococcales bacterium]|nr:hypothetical protein [Myxococcales bacterium]